MLTTRIRLLSPLLASTRAAVCNRCSLPLHFTRLSVAVIMAQRPQQPAGANGAARAASSSSNGAGSSTRSSSVRPRLSQIFAAPTSAWASSDIQEYQQHYPGQVQRPQQRKNLDFYLGRIESSPRPSGKIDEIHQRWLGDYRLLEQHHGYIQWLFPIREKGMNFDSQPLYLHEIEGIKADAAARARLVESYKLMLDFYGMKLVDERLGLLSRASNFAQRYEHLNRSSHNYLRITRILKCLGELGREDLKLGFLLHFVRELSEGKLDHRSVGKSAVNYWFPVLRSSADRARLQSVIRELREAEDAGGAGGPVVLTEERMRQVLEERLAERKAQRGGDGDDAASASADGSDAASAAHVRDFGEGSSPVSDSDEELSDSEESPRARAEAGGRTVAASAAPASSSSAHTAASSPSSSSSSVSATSAKRKADSAEAEDSPRAKKTPTPTTGASATLAAASTAQEK